MGFCEDQRTWNVHATVIREKEEGGTTSKKKRMLGRRKDQQIRIGKQNQSDF